MPTTENTAPNMATVNDMLLQADGVLRFVMEGERVGGVLPPFDRAQLVLESNHNRGKEGVGDGGKAEGVKDKLISSLREEIKHTHGEHPTRFTRASHTLHITFHMTFPK